MGLFFAKVRTFHRFCTHFAEKITKFNYSITRSNYSAKNVPDFQIFMRCSVLYTAQKCSFSMDLADIKICKTLIINVFYFANSLNSYYSQLLL